jgi:phenylpyruvate tautomerase PptA (4-oxalocrotonate tautomerase family)
MPICEINYPCGLFSENEKNNIVERVTKLLLEAEGLEDNPISRSICLVNIEESSSMYIGGKRTDKGKVVIKIFAFQEAFSNEIKENLYLKITNIFVEENKLAKELNGNNIWCMIFPINGNNFGVGGRPITLEITRKIVSSYKS